MSSNACDSPTVTVYGPAAAHQRGRPRFCACRHEQQMTARAVRGGAHVARRERAVPTRLAFEARGQRLAERIGREHADVDRRARARQTRGPAIR